MKRKRSYQVFGMIMSVLGIGVTFMTDWVDDKLTHEAIHEEVRAEFERRNSAMFQESKKEAE